MLFYCYNKNDYCDHSDDCSSCDVLVKGKGGRFVPSKSDRIRSMSDEELAAFWAENYDNFCQNKPECCELIDTDEGIPEEWCVACALEYIRRPAEEVSPCG